MTRSRLAWLCALLATLWLGGSRALAAACCSGVMARVMPVSVKPGATELTAMRWRRRSIAIARVNPITPAFEAT